MDGNGEDFTFKSPSTEDRHNVIPLAAAQLVTIPVSILTSQQNRCLPKTQTCLWSSFIGVSTKRVNAKPNGSMPIEWHSTYASYPKGRTDVLSWRKILNTARTDHTVQKDSSYFSNLNNFKYLIQKYLFVNIMFGKLFTLPWKLIKLRIHWFWEN